MPAISKFDNGYLKKLGINAHEVKADYGCNPVAHYDIYNGDTVTIRNKRGELYADTCMTKTEFINYYSSKGGKGYGK